MSEMKEEMVQKENENPKLRLAPLTRIIIFFCFFVIHLLNCSDGGVVSARPNQIKKELNIDDKAFGIYGSVVQIGRIIGTFSVMVLLNFFNRKYLIFFALLLKCASFLIYFVTSNYVIIMIFRFLQGFSHVFTYVYFPTWVDQFGLQKYKTVMTSLIQTASPFGSVFGFNATTFLDDFKYGFALLAFSILALNFILLFMPDKYFSPKIFFYKKVSEEHDGRESIYSLFEIDEEKMKQKQAEKSKKPEGPSIWFQLLRPVFATIVLARTVIMFSFMGLHYWIGDYFQNVLNQDGKFAKATIYSLVSLLGPFLGSMVGAAICECFGGYTKKHSSLLCFVFSILTGISAVFTPMVDNLTYFTILLFAFFFCANLMMPILIGISFNCVDKKIRGASYGVNSLMCTFLGNLPAPSVYGFINAIYKDTNKRLAMTINLNYIWVNTILVGLNYYFRLKEKSPEELEEENEGKEQELKDINNPNEE
jgi:predicted MFS family arabinose efflux permease